MDLVLYGFGNVGRTLVSMILERLIPLKVSAVFDRSGGVYAHGGFSREELERLLNVPRGGIARSGIGRPIDVSELGRAILVDVTPPDYNNPHTWLYRQVAESGGYIVTANKSVLAKDFDKLDMRRVFFKATVMAGTPLIDLLMGLPPQRPIRVSGILNASSNYVLTEVCKKGKALEEAVAEAQRAGILEPDPTLDLEGVDAAAKITIIANVIGLRARLEDVAVSGVLSGRLECPAKLMALADAERKVLKVGLERVGPESPFHGVDHVMNAVEIVTDLNRVFLMGKGAGPHETASVLINDILKALGRPTIV